MTEQELINLITLRIQMGVGVPTPPAAYANYLTWEDVSDYAGSLTAGQSVVTVMKVLSPVSIGVYENAGYATNDFSDPDYPDNNPNTVQLPLAVNSQPVQGVYSFLIKAKFDDGIGGGFTVQKTIVSYPLCQDNDRPTPALSLTYDCEEGTFTSTDVTNYGNQNLTLISRAWANTVYPPAVSGQTPTTVDASINEVGNLWTGTYEAKLIVTVTYNNGNTTFVFYITTTDELKVVCDNALCTLYCCLQSIRNKYYEFAAAQGLQSTEVQTLYRKLLLGTTEYFMAVRAQLCGQPITTHIERFYQVTQCNPNCDGCPDAPAPVIPATTTIQGEDGTDGLTAEFQFNGAIFQWKYTTDVIWTDLFDFSTLNLVPTFSGYNYSLLVADETNVSTNAVSVTQTLKTATIDFTDALLICPVGNTGDYIKIKAVFIITPNVQSFYPKTVYLNFGSLQIGDYLINTTGIANPTIVLELEVRRSGAATQDILVRTTRTSQISTYRTTGTETWGGNITITAQGNVGDPGAAVDSITITTWSIETFRTIT